MLCLQHRSRRYNCHCHPHHSASDRRWKQHQEDHGSHCCWSNCLYSHRTYFLGYSSTFTQEVHSGGSEVNKSTFSSRLKSGKPQKPGLCANLRPWYAVVKDGGDAMLWNFRELGHRAVGFADSNLASQVSTEQIIDLTKGGILMTTHVSIAGRIV